MRRPDGSPPAAKRARARPPDEGELLGVLHDVGHELATLCLLLEAAMGRPGLDEPAREGLVPVRRQADRLLEVVRGSVHPTAAPAPEVVEVREILEQIVSLVALSSQARVSVAPGPRVWLRVDEVQLWRMVTNLVDNAVRAAGPGGVVEVAMVHNDSLVILVSDDGPGIHSGAAGWASLGLGIVAGLAESNRCVFDVYAREIGGTSARLVFPPSALAMPTAGSTR